MPVQQRVLVYCANGFQGRAIVTALLAGDCRVRALVRDEGKAAALAAVGAELARADLSDRRSLRRAHEDVDAVVIQLPSGDPPELARDQISSAPRCDSPRRIRFAVLNTAVLFPRQIQELPQFAAKRDVERSVLAPASRSPSSARRSCCPIFSCHGPAVRGTTGSAGLSGR